jgi:formate hydrogenlyase transcriptional activator
VKNTGSSSQTDQPQASAARPLFEELFARSPDTILVADSEGIIVEASEQAEMLFGYSRQELLGSPIENLLPERFRKAHRNNRRQYATNPHIRPMGVGLDLYGLNKSGLEFPVDIMLSPVESPSTGCVVAVVRDITRRKRMEEELRQSEERFHLMVDGARDYAIFMLDTEGRVATWNPGAERIKGYRADEIVGRHFSVFYSQEDIDRKKPQHELDIVREEGRYEDEGWRIRKDGSRFWASVIITGLRNEKKELIGFAKVTRDLTNRKRAEDALLLELSAVVLSRQDIGQMLSAIAASIRQVVPYECAEIDLFDPDTNLLRVHKLFPESNARQNKEVQLSVDDSPAGWVFRKREPLFADLIESVGFPEESMARHIAAGARSGCWLPLNSNGNVIGTLFIGGREGAFKVTDKNMLLQIAAQIALAVDNVNAFRQISDLTNKLKEEKRYLEEELRTEYSFEEIVGESPSLKRVLKQVETVAPTDATVLILGETGTGKELVARSLHDLSARRNHTFVKVNCSAIPMGLLESELFGHEKGAFTGAIAQRVGRLELAHQGTLFLDEIGDLPLELQPKLLRALQGKEIERLGGKKAIPVDFRLLAATHRDLAKMVKEGQFRSDLYYRLKVFPILIPPLKQRKEDIPLLVNYFVAKHARRMNKHIETVPPNVMAALSRWHWPGNIRELENFIERAVILTTGPALRAPLAELEAPEQPSIDSDSSLESKEREHILHVLRSTRGVIAGAQGAAAKLGLKRTTLNSRLRKLGIERREYMS